ncbi:hypothetical protein BS50DRAFT_343428 [Corynespora cassiicola Philippines]|uniref:N-acetyltransferase domain-containing protein n=1 Tax=Corynespora cassiicola Philippines TaxID=1448308 RepID=A0A2T2NVT8_CORCC|nr:hypothetical protein BS50DRAFT_343428 [Corynespora cassiicola Philippines]
MQQNGNSRFVLKQVETRQEMDAVMDVIWVANYDPYEPFAQLVFPVLGYTERDRELAVQESKTRFWNIHQKDPSSHWYYIADSKTGQAVGCGQWQMFEESPFKGGGPKMQAPWWPEGECREFCESILNQVYKPRETWMRKPHFALNWLAVLPAYRRAGIASLILSHGISLADSKEFECFLESSAMGKQLYGKFGFRSLSQVNFDTRRTASSGASNEDTDAWRKCVHELTPEPVTAMWRPKQGVWVVDGKEIAKPCHVA